MNRMIEYAEEMRREFESLAMCSGCGMPTPITPGHQQGLDYMHAWCSIECLQEWHGRV